MKKGLLMLEKWNKLSIVVRIIIGIIIGTILGTFIPGVTQIAVLGEIFVGMLKGIAPILVFFIVLSAIAQHKPGHKTNMSNIVLLYLLGTFLASVTAVIASFIFKLNIVLVNSDVEAVPPQGVGEVLHNLLINIVKNPIASIAEGNFIGILFWAIMLGFAFRKTANETKEHLQNISQAVSKVVMWVIDFAPLGIVGLVFATISKSGFDVFTNYGSLVLLLVGVMFFYMLIINPIIVFFHIRKNPYPLVLRCIRESGITAFFTRSSAANIPVNMKLCEDLGLDRDSYSVSIPLGATINMGGASITIAILTLATVNTLNINVDIQTAIILSLLSAICACGASGIAGGSLLLIPLACSLFGIGQDIAIQVVGVGYIIGVIQDSCETAVNSSTDVLYTACADYRAKLKNKK